MVYGIIAVLVFPVLYYFTQRADARATVASYPAGGAEGNDMVVWLYKTNHPTYDQLEEYNLGFYLLCLLPLFVPYVMTGNAALGGFSLSVSAGFTIGSYLSVRKWKKWEKT